MFVIPVTRATYRSKLRDAGQTATERRDLGPGIRRDERWKK